MVYANDLALMVIEEKDISGHQIKGKKSYVAVLLVKWPRLDKDIIYTVEYVQQLKPRIVIRYRYKVLTLTRNYFYITQGNCKSRENDDFVTKATKVIALKKQGDWVIAEIILINLGIQETRKVRE